MKKLLAAFAAAIVALALVACASTSTTTSTATSTTASTTSTTSAATTSVAATAATILANLQTVVVDGCSVIQPTLESVSGIDASVTAAATANGLFCTAASSITVTSAQTLLDTGIPAVITVVNNSTYIAAAQKPIIVAALSLFKLTVQNAIKAYNTAISTVSAAVSTSGAAVASGASAASEPAASAAVAASSAQ